MGTYTITLLLKSGKFKQDMKITEIAVVLTSRPGEKNCATSEILNLEGCFIITVKK